MISYTESADEAPAATFVSSAAGGEQLSPAKADLLARATSLLATLEGAKPDGASAFLVPGRIEFLGKHTDYAGGRSLLCTVDRGFAMMGVPRKDRTVRIVNGSRATIFELDPDLTVTMGHWSNYAMTVGRRIARNFPGGLIGADISFASDLPQSSGMSSSSAMIVGFFLMLAKINRLNERDEYLGNIRSLEDLAGYLGTVENGKTFGTLAGDNGVGTFGGSEDHTAILCSKPGFVRQYSFCPIRFERDVPLPEGYVLAVGTSGVIAEKTGAARSKYNALSLSVQAIVQQWQRRTEHSEATLADIVAGGEPALTLLRRLLGEPRQDQFTASRLFERLEQFIVESNQIIPAAATALADGRLEELGKLVARSQDLAERLLQNQVPETIFLAKAARDCGAVAASAFGAGFGGSVWALVSCAGADKFLAEWRSKYARQFPERATASTFFLTGGGSPALDVSTFGSAQD